MKDVTIMVPGLEIDRSVRNPNVNIECLFFYWILLQKKQKHHHHPNTLWHLLQSPARLATCLLLGMDSTRAFRSHCCPSWGSAESLCLELRAWRWPWSPGAFLHQGPSIFNGIQFQAVPKPLNEADDGPLPEQCQDDLRTVAGGSILKTVHYSMQLHENTNFSSIISW